MKRLITLSVFTMSFFILNAQQDYFLFIQETSGKPFYVRIGEVSHSSSAGGHLILAPLKDSLYNLNIGFARGAYPEQLFTVAMNKKDRGFELKNVNGSWQLFDLQSLELLRPVLAESDTTLQKRTDSYSNLMAGVVDDTAVLYAAKDTSMALDSLKKLAATGQLAVGIPEVTDSSATPVVIVKKDKKKGKSKNKKEQAVVKEIPVEKTDTTDVPVTKVDVGIKRDTILRAEVKSSDSLRTDSSHTADSGAAPFRDKRDIIRYSTENVSGGKSIIYLDRSGIETDTIRIIIPRKL